MKKKKKKFDFNLDKVHIRIHIRETKMQFAQQFVFWGDFVTSMWYNE